MVMVLLTFKCDLKSGNGIIPTTFISSLLPHLSFTAHMNVLLFQGTTHSFRKSIHVAFFIDNNINAKIKHCYDLIQIANWKAISGTDA